MPAQAAKAPPAINFERAYPGTADRLGRVRSDLTEIAGECPVIDELVLLASELAANAVQHSNSGRTGHGFTVRATLYPGDYAWVEVVDEGGAWKRDQRDDEHGRGLAVVAAIAGDGNWGIEGDSACRVAWFRLDWPRP
jgi:serine/threonine-protein kinase RsbW